MLPLARGGVEDQTADELHQTSHRRMDFVHILLFHSCQLFSLLIDKGLVVFPALDHRRSIEDVEHGLHEAMDLLDILENLALGVHVIRLSQHRVLLNVNGALQGIDLAFHPVDQCAETEDHEREDRDNNDLEHRAVSQVRLLSLRFNWSIPHPRNYAIKQRSPEG